MNAVDDTNAGVASGVNNTASRLAGVLAIALLTALAVSVFSSSLDMQLEGGGVAPGVRERLLARTDMLAELDVPAGVANAAGISAMIESSYVHAFRRIALACALSAALSALVAWLTLRPRQSPRQGVGP
jgi:hypothetical protein